MSIKLKYLILIVFCAFLATFFYGKHLGLIKADNQSKEEIARLNTKIHVYTVEINDARKYVAQKEQEIKTLSQAKKDGDIRNEELRKLKIKHLNEITRLSLLIDTLMNNIVHDGHIIHVDTVIIDKTEYNAIKLPFSFNKTDQWLSLTGMFNKEGKLDMSVKMQADLDIYTTVQKKSKNPITIITTDNPYLKTISIKSQRLDMPKPKKSGIGIQIGYGFDVKRMTPTPYIGIGVSRNLIRF